MRRRRFFCIFLVLLVVLAVAPSVRADEDAGTYDFIYNDEIWKMSNEKPVIEKDGFTCVPFDRFFKLFGGSYLYDDTIKNFTWFHYTDVYSFNVATGTCTVNREEPVPAPAFYENGSYYLPMEFIMKELGYIFSRLPNGICRVVTRADVTYADEDFMMMYNSRYSENSKPRDRADYYLAVPGQPSSRTSEIIAALDRYGISATFFMTEEAMKANPSMVRKIVASGYPYGFTLPESGDPLAYVESANTTLQKLTRRKTALTFVRDRDAALSESDRAALEAKGYRVWDSNITLPTEGAEESAGDVVNFKIMLSLGKFNSVVSLTGSGLSDYLPMLRQLDAEGQIRLHTADEMQAPLNRWSDLW